MHNMALSKIQLLKLLGLVVGCATKFVTGSLFVFNVYQSAIKDTFNYTQTEVEILSSMLNLGLGVGFLPGMFYDRFGPQLTSACGLVFSVSAYILIWSTTKSVKFYSNSSWLMAIYFFMSGLGSAFMYMVALNTNVINFDKRWTGTVVGILNAFFSGSSSVFAVIYYHLFDQDFAGFMLLFAILFGIVDILCIIFLRIENDESPKFVQFTDDAADGDDSKQDNLSKANSNINSAEDTERNHQDVMCVAKTEPIVLDNTIVQNDSNSSEAPLSLKQICLNMDYQILIWLVAVTSSIGLVYVNNITVISKSMHLDHYDDRLTIIIPITTAIISVLVGFVSDQLLDRLPRMWILLFACTCYVASQVLVLLFAYEFTVLVLATIIAGIGIAMLWSLSPTIMMEMFYVGNLGRNWGIAILLAALLGFGAQEIYGSLYDSQIIKPNIDCYGMKCIQGGTIVCVGLSSVSVMLGVLLQVKKTCSRRCFKKIERSSLSETL